MKMGSFLASVGTGVAIGALGVLMLPKNGEIYKLTKEAANSIKQEAGNVLGNMNSLH